MKTDSMENSLSQYTESVLTSRYNLDVSICLSQRIYIYRGLWKNLFEMHKRGIKYDSYPKEFITEKDEFVKNCSRDTKNSWKDLNPIL